MGNPTLPMILILGQAQYSSIGGGIIDNWLMSKVTRRKQRRRKRRARYNRGKLGIRPRRRCVGG